MSKKKAVPQSEDSKSVQDLEIMPINEIKALIYDHMIVIERNMQEVDKAQKAVVELNAVLRKRGA